MIALNGSPTAVRACVLALLGLGPELRATAAWLTLDQAAESLGVPIHALRKRVEVEALRARVRGEPAHEITLDGVRFRKLGRLWRVSLGTWGQS